MQQIKLKSAIQTINVKKVFSLLEKDIQVNWAYSDGFTPITLAKYCSIKIKLIAFSQILTMLSIELIDKGGFNVLLNNKHTMLTWAIINNNMKAFEAIISYSDYVNVNQKTYYGSPLFLAKKHNNTDMIAALKKLGAKE